MRIAFVSQLFDPENSIKGLEFARRLQALGHDVEVITTFPSYPLGRVYAGYEGAWFRATVVDGIRIVRLPTFISHGKSSIGRLISYLSFGLVAFFYSLFFLRRVDVFYAYYPPVVAGLMALVVSRLRRVPFVYDIQDLWPDALVATGMTRNKFIIGSIERACRLIYRRAAGIVVLSDGYLRSLQSKGVSTQKIRRIFNWCDESRLLATNGQSAKALVEGKFNILYAGNLGAAQALEHVISAASIVQQAGNDHIRFVFLGSGIASDSLKMTASEYQLTNVVFLPQVPAEQAAAIIQEADAVLAHLADERIFEITVPSKTQAYLSLGKPILMAVKGEAAQIVSRAKAGITVEPCQPAKLAAAASKLAELSGAELAEMGRNGRDFYLQNMSMQKGVMQVEALLTEVTEQR